MSVTTKGLVLIGITLIFYILALFNSQGGIGSFFIFVSVSFSFVMGAYLGYYHRVAKLARAANGAK